MYNRSLSKFKIKLTHMLMEITPSHSLGPLCLGATVNQTLSQLNSFHRLIYSPHTPTPMVLSIPSINTNCHFNSTTQRLTLIEIFSTEGLKLQYRGKLVRQWDMRTVYNDVFGPTYPGLTLEGSYVLSYPGISFKFAATGGDGDLLDELLRQNAPVLAIAVHGYKHFSDWGPSLSCALLKNPIELDKLMVESTTDRSKGEENRVLVKFLKHPHNLKSYELKVNGSQQQDVLRALGPPDDTFVKSDTKTMIHSSNGIIEDTASHTFHNYFQLGIDLLYRDTTLTKVIIHNNTPLDTLLFGKYERCGFEYAVNGMTYVINGDTRLKEIREYLQMNSISPVIINRSSRSVADDVEVIDYENETEGCESDVEVRSLCFVDDYYGFIWDIFGGDCGVIGSLTVY